MKRIFDSYAKAWKLSCILKAYTYCVSFYPTRILTFSASCSCGTLMRYDEWRRPFFVSVSFFPFSIEPIRVRVGSCFCVLVNRCYWNVCSAFLFPQFHDHSSLLSAYTDVRKGTLRLLRQTTSPRFHVVRITGSSLLHFRLLFSAIIRAVTGCLNKISKGRGCEVLYLPVCLFGQAGTDVPGGMQRHPPLCEDPRMPVNWWKQFNATCSSNRWRK